MKFAISLYLVIMLNCSASPIRLFYEDEPSHAYKIRETLVRNYRIPEDLIELNKILNCSIVREKGRFDLCLKNNGDLLVVSVDRVFISESLKIFRAP